MEKLSKQDQDFVNEVAITGNQTQSAKKAYGIEDDKYASVKGVRQIGKDSIKTAIEEVKKTLAERIPDDLLEQKHLALLHKLDKEGEIDVQAVTKGLDMGYKLKGAYAPEKTVNLDINVDITDPKARELAEEYEEKLKQGL